MGNNPIRYNDILGDTIRYQGSRLFKFKKKAQIFIQSIFGSKEVRGIIKELKTNKHDVLLDK